MDPLTPPSFGQNSFLSILSAYGAAQGFVLAGVFWLRRSGDVVANRLLAGLFLAVTIHLTEIFFYVTGLMEYVPWLSGLGFPFIYLVGPTYLAYTRRLLDPAWRLRWHSVFHLIPAIVVFSRGLRWLLAPSEAKIPFFRAIARGDDIPVSDETFVLLLFNVAQNLVYLVLTWRAVRRHESVARDYLSDNAIMAGLASLRTVTVSFAAYVALHMGLFVALRIWGNEGGALVDTIWLFVISVFLQINGYAAICRPENFSQAMRGTTADQRMVGATESAPGPESVLSTEPSPEARSAGFDRSTEQDREAAGKYHHSGLPPDEAEAIRRRLIEYMESGSPHRSGSLTLGAVARAVGASTHHLSLVLNRDVGQRFFDFVNAYRVEDAKRMIAASGTPRTVLEIAFESGFNNKTSFNAAFRKFTDTTPTEYRRKMRGQDETGGS